MRECKNGKKLQNITVWFDLQLQLFIPAITNRRTLKSTLFIIFGLFKKKI